MSTPYFRMVENQLLHLPVGEVLELPMRSDAADADINAAILSLSHDGFRATVTEDNRKRVLVVRRVGINDPQENEEHAHARLKRGDSY
jgi:hypothetical protein